jgi:hypothetical protein
MSSFLDQVCDQINLQWAWEKVKKASVPGDIWIDEAALAHFEVHLANELESIALDLRRGRYRIAPIRPMAFPKNPDADGNPRVRQYFNFSIRDQVVWVAAVNILGPLVDAGMPHWSYGNRLFRSAWIDEGEDGVKRRKVGPYRHSSGRIYRPFQQAWPLFRRHVALSIFAATHVNSDTSGLDPDDRDELELQQNLPRNARCPYVFGSYWSRQSGPSKLKELYWASVDLEKFYPSISLPACISSIVQSIPESMRSEVAHVLGMLTKLPLDLSGWQEEELRHIELDGSRRRFHRIPTGLLVSGFLANAAMLSVDQAVDREMPRGRIAHFRYVDDHIVLATSFEDLVAWLRKYRELILEFGCGARINAAKTEPEALGKLMVSLDDSASSANRESEVWSAAREKCRLDPEFPVPLMTKTIALVSAIGRTDFTALEDSELGILTQQLEHLLLVEHAETEMPERTRLAFAATRLARVAEARLASPEMLISETRSAAKRRGGDEESEVADALSMGDELVALLSGVDDARVHDRLGQLANRVFGLVRRVLKEKPDRVRLWTHALVIARRLGATGLGQLFADIELYSKDSVNRLAANYVLGNSYAVLAAECIRAAQMLVDSDAAGWRRVASLRFLRNVAEFSRSVKGAPNHPWFVERSFRQFCVGLYCADWLIRHGIGDPIAVGASFDDRLTALGHKFMSSGELAPSTRVALAWWGAKFELRRPLRSAPPLVIALGKLVQELPESDDLWSFFPSDAPPSVLRRLADGQQSTPRPSERDGWWFDALHGRAEWRELPADLDVSPRAARAWRAMTSRDGSKQLPLPLWAEKVWSRKDPQNDSEWRLGEWTCLEIVRQAAELLSAEAIFDKDYLQRNTSRHRRLVRPCAHPFNFTLPAALTNVPASSWQVWRGLLRSDGGRVVRLAPERSRIQDARYAPLVLSPIGPGQNSIRGLGLCLLGLLSRSFLLPIQWNGVGHESVLRHLPMLLRSEITYSSATLGVLEACLQPRASENTLARLHKSWAGEFDDDTEHDPIGLIDTKQLAVVIERAQSELERNQISTFNQHSRQVTPVDLMHLTDANWKSYFGMDAA